MFRFGVDSFARGVKNEIVKFDSTSAGNRNNIRSEKDYYP